MTDQPPGTAKYTRIQVGNLAASATEVRLRALFGRYGHVISFEQPLDPKTGRPGPYAYIEMAAADAERAVAGIDGFEIAGQPLAVSADEPTTSWAADAERRWEPPPPRRTVLDPSTPPDDTPMRS